MPLALQHFGQFGGMGGLTRTLQAAHHDGTGRTVCRRQARRLATHQGGQLFIDDLDHHLGGVRLSMTWLPTARSVTAAVKSLATL